METYLKAARTGDISAFADTACDLSELLRVSARFRRINLIQYFMSRGAVPTIEMVAHAIRRKRCDVIIQLLTNPSGIGLYELWHACASRKYLLKLVIECVIDSGIDISDIVISCITYWHGELLEDILATRTGPLRPKVLTVAMHYGWRYIDKIIDFIDDSEPEEIIKAYKWCKRISSLRTYAQCILDRFCAHMSPSNIEEIWNLSVATPAILTQLLGYGLMISEDIIRRLMRKRNHLCLDVILAWPVSDATALFNIYQAAKFSRGITTLLKAGIKPNAMTLGALLGENIDSQIVIALQCGALDVCDTDMRIRELLKFCGSKVLQCIVDLGYEITLARLRYIHYNRHMENIIIATEYASESALTTFVDEILSRSAPVFSDRDAITIMSIPPTEEIFRRIRGTEYEVLINTCGTWNRWWYSGSVLYVICSDEFVNIPDCAELYGINVWSSCVNYNSNAAIKKFLQTFRQHKSARS
jgi:hypothetical protein